MDACTTHPATRAAPGRTAASATALSATIAAWARRLDAWLAQRARAARDREVLADMSERELKDIGLSRGFVDDAASGAWHRDTVR
jgi:uncharacterized protein YjiS (DUF1127 family)